MLSDTDKECCVGEWPDRDGRNVQRDVLAPGRQANTVRQAWDMDTPTIELFLEWIVGLVRVST